MDNYFLILIGLALPTFAIRLGGFYLGNRLPAHGGWATALRALPGCLITALVAVLLAQAGPAEWGAAAVAAAVALTLRNLPLTMAAGILAVLALRALG
jgi:uncharacterized membrane protein